jgi:hypothetical protein
MPIIRYVPQDPTDVVLQGEQLRQGVFDADNVPPYSEGLLQGGQLLAGFPEMVADEDAFYPMNSFSDVGILAARRNKNGVTQTRANGGIATPCGAWVPLDWSPLVLHNRFVHGYERLSLAGVSRDSSGATLGNCVVKIFLTSSDQKQFEKISDGSGNWSVGEAELGANPGPFYYVEYKVGSPDVAGTSLNTNVPTKTN